MPLIDFSIGPNESNSDSELGHFAAVVLLKKCINQFTNVSFSMGKSLLHHMMDTEVVIPGFGHHVNLVSKHGEVPGGLTRTCTPTLLYF